MQDKFDERDEFWDLAKLVPKKKENILPFSTKSQVAEYVIPGAGEEKNDENTKISFEKYKSDASFEERSYIPENYPLIKQVTVKKFNDKYDFYDSFRKAAEIYFDYKTEKCEFAAFYSYMPQYSQLTLSQKNYYFYTLLQQNKRDFRLRKPLKTHFNSYMVGCFQCVHGRVELRGQILG